LHGLPRSGSCTKPSSSLQNSRKESPAARLPVRGPISPTFCLTPRSSFLSSDPKDEDYLAVAEAAARAGGAVLNAWAGKFTVSEKGPADLVTEADVASQEAIYEVLQTRFPQHGFLGEEGLQSTSAQEKFRWLIDPLDGTSNYVHRFPYYAVSIALEHRGRLEAGVIYDPTRDELFAARRGRGATVNGAPLR